MLDDHGTGDPVLHLPGTEWKSLEPFLDALQEDRDRLAKWFEDPSVLQNVTVVPTGDYIQVPIVESVEAALELCERFECDKQSSLLLSFMAEKADDDQLFDCFVLASKCNDVFAGTKILCRGARTTYSAGFREVKLLPLGNNGWDMKDASRLSSSWLWAVVSAALPLEIKRAQNGHLRGHNSQEYWDQLAGSFFRSLTMSEESLRSN